MLEAIKQQLRLAVARGIQKRFGVDHVPVVEIPPRRDLGDLAFPAGLHLARVLKRNPRVIAEELVDGLEMPEAVREVRVEGAGYLNVFLDRGRAVARLLSDPLTTPAPDLPKVVLEHTNINPNKAAHVGHLRNSVLGDILARVLRSLGHPVEVQNYIDDTGVQVADIVIGFTDLRGSTAEEVAALPEPFDFTCWDLYAEVGRWYEGHTDAKDLRRRTLHELESGSGERAQMARLVAARIIQRHLRTMTRLGIGYDLLTHESAILGRHFFDGAFERLKESGAIQLERDGKNAGCWIMPLSESEEFKGLEDPDKVIVRSDGTVTYVGKDIAYQMWKFGLLQIDFAYRYWNEAEIWQTVVEGVDEHPSFGGGHTVINVIDSRQSYLQKIVRAGLEAMGHHEQAERSIHFAYEFVSLSNATARQLGFLDDEDTSGVLEISGRKGIGVKADDLIDQLEARSREEISSRNRDLVGTELDELARTIATAAIRFFMAKATTTRVIAFDLDEALSFEGETGPYLQYSMVRARNIWRKLDAAGLATSVSAERAASLPAEVWADDLWDLVLAVAQTPERIATAGSTLEISLVARHALDLAQKFNAVYHKHPILQEKDADLRDARLAATRVFARGLETLADLLGIPLPERM
ncbi:MAG: arginine--tRNA ligase [Acidobacteria bacterium]|nr:arginine--tRNA ligase [Acidobacteriota bacterium]